MPAFLIDYLANHPLSQDLYPTAAGHYPVAHNHHMSRPDHTSHLIIYCTHGRGTATIEGAEHKIQAGDLLVLPKGCAHEYQADAESPWTIFWVHYDGSHSQAYTDFIEVESPVVSIGAQPRLIADFDALFSRRQDGFSRPDYVHTACQLKQMLTGIGEIVRHHQTRRGRQIDLDHIQGLMHLSLQGKLDLDMLAAQAKLSKYHFSRKFKQLTGHSPIQHFLHLKMQHACQLLDNTQLSIKQVAGEVGYDDAYYFSRLFKQIIGLAPSKYRQNRQT
ncbi:MAG: helix-turn-helix domain-containing protein, partial [Pseudomonadales bacterium]